MAKIPDHYKLLNEHEKSYEVHDARDGKSFHIPKKGLANEVQKKLGKLQKFADGGEAESSASDVEGFDSGIKPWVTADVKPSGTNSLYGLVPSDEEMYGSKPQAAPVPVGVDSPPSAGAPDLAPAEPDTQALAVPGQSASAAPVDASSASPDLLKQYQQNTEQQIQGMQNAGAAKSSELKEQSEIQKSANDSMRDFFAQSQQALWNQNVQNENLAQEVASAKIDPNRFMDSKSTGSKIATALSLVLGGIGAGLTHGPNMGYETIQKAIAQDIDAQKANIDNKRSLLSMNLQKYGSMQAAQTATMLQMNSMVQGQVAQTAAKWGAQANQGATQAVLGKLKNDYMMQSQQLQQLVVDQKIKQHLAGGDVSNQNPLDYIPHVVPVDKHKEVATEIGDAMHVAKSRQEMLNLYDQALKEQTLLRTGAGYARTSPALKALSALADPIIHDKDGRVTPEVKHDFAALLPAAGDFGSTAETKKKAFNQYLDAKGEAPLARTYGIDINRFKSSAGRGTGGDLTGENAQAFQWAKANPTNPKSAMIMKKLGY